MHGGLNAKNRTEGAICECCDGGSNFGVFLRCFGEAIDECFVGVFVGLLGVFGGKPKVCQQDGMHDMLSDRFMAGIGSDLHDESLVGGRVGLIGSIA